MNSWSSSPYWKRGRTQDRPYPIRLGPAGLIPISFHASYELKDPNSSCFLPFLLLLELLPLFLKLPVELNLVNLIPPIRPIMTLSSCCRRSSRSSVRRTVHIITTSSCRLWTDLVIHIILLWDLFIHINWFLSADSGEFVRPVWA